MGEFLGGGRTVRIAREGSVAGLFSGNMLRMMAMKGIAMEVLETAEDFSRGTLLGAWRACCKSWLLVNE